MLGQLMGAFIVILIGFALVPTISEQLQLAQTNSTSTMPNYAKTTLGLVVPFFAIAIALASVAMAVSSLRDFNSYSSDYEVEYKDVPEKEKPHKQTYLEYVRERREVERIMHEK